MAQGLDELVEWLVGEVSFYGDGESNASRPLSFPVGVASIFCTSHAFKSRVFMATQGFF